MEQKTGELIKHKERNGEKNRESKRRKETNADKLDRQAERLTKDFESLADSAGKKRENIKKAQINTLKTEGAKPFKIFTEIVGEYSRADNIFCGINGEADHKVISEYLKEVAQESDEDMREVLNWLAEKGEKLSEYRKLVKIFLILDQLTDGNNYKEGHIVDEETVFFNSSLGDDIASRVLPETVKTKLLTQMSNGESLFSTWKKEREKWAALGNEVLPFIYPHDPESYRGVIENGARNKETSEYWRESIDTSKIWTERLAQALSAEKPEPQEIGDNLAEFMSRLTAAQAVLESQYYHVGVGLLRTTASNKLPNAVKEKIKGDLNESRPIEQKPSI